MPDRNHRAVKSSRISLSPIVCTTSRRMNEGQLEPDKDRHSTRQTRLFLFQEHAPEGRISVENALVHPRGVEASGRVD